MLNFDYMKIADMFLASSPQNMHFIDDAFSRIYRDRNIAYNFKKEKGLLKYLYQDLVEKHKKSNLDLIQELQYNQFINDLNDIIRWMS